MTIPVLTCINHLQATGKTSLAYHVSWMLSDMGQDVLVCDLDPQADLTSLFLDAGDLQEICDNRPLFTLKRTDGGSHEWTREDTANQTLDVRKITPNLFLLPGNPTLATLEEEFACDWYAAVYGNDLVANREFRGKLWSFLQGAATQCEASVIIVDVGSNLGFINRAVYIGSDWMIIPVKEDYFSLCSLRTLGQVLNQWSRDWKALLEKCWDSGLESDKEIPQSCVPIGYVLQKRRSKTDHSVISDMDWVQSIHEAYLDSMAQLGVVTDSKLFCVPSVPDQCLARLSEYRSLWDMAREVRKPIFHLTSADGAIGSFGVAVLDAHRAYRALAEKIVCIILSKTRC